MGQIECIPLHLHIKWGGKGVDIPPWGLRVKPHKLHSCGQ
jgi:hypothetical protein